MALTKTETRILQAVFGYRCGRTLKQPGVYTTTRDSHAHLAAIRLHAQTGLVEPWTVEEDEATVYVGAAVRRAES